MDMPDVNGMERQLAIFLAGVRGEWKRRPVTYEELREKARDELPDEAYGYVAGGAGSEDTMHANREAFRRWRIVPRHLRGIGARDLSTELLGRRLPAPVLLAPIGVLGIVHEGAEPAVARAAGPLGVPIVLSTVSSRPMEAVAEAGGAGPRWFQLYWPNDPELAESFVGRAEAAGFSAIVLTVDLPLLAWRPRDIANAYLPFLRGDGIANYLSDPVFRAGLPLPPEQEPAPAIERFGQVFGNPGLTWDDLAWLRGRTALPIAIKGILDPVDARRALDAGADSVVVSNHGGRQVDGALAALDALPRVVEAVGGRAPVLFDSGIRTAADAFKAIALGATAVLVGRPYVWALAAGGEEGVREWLLDFLADFDLTLGLAGCRSIAEIDTERLVQINL